MIVEVPKHILPQYLMTVQQRNLLRGTLLPSLQRYADSEGTRKLSYYFLSSFLQGPGTFMSFAQGGQRILEKSEEGQFGIEKVTVHLLQPLLP